MWVTFAKVQHIRLMKSFFTLPLFDRLPGSLLRTETSIFYLVHLDYGKTKFTKVRVFRPEIQMHLLKMIIF